jgi:uncharacterized protein YgiM (DUF1202 family)
MSSGTDGHGSSRPSRDWLIVTTMSVGIVALLSVAAGVSSQAPGAGQPSAERVRVPTSHANVHMGPNTTTEVLVLVPRGTVLTVLGRDKEWIQVRLTPELRKTGMVMRWYKNEDRGWMHDSTVEVLKPPAR